MNDLSGPLFGFYRCKVVNNKDPEKFGRVLIWIPVLMPDVSDETGVWARPGNNPMGGRNMENDSEHHYSGSSYIPKIGSWMWCFFEAGDINNPYYFGALDLENTMVLPENQLGTNYEDKWTVLKTHMGRVIVLSDDPDDERVEIGGKKRQMTNPPTGDTESVYQIDDNMTTILFDEREGKEKVLIRTVHGDFFHIDIDERKLQAEFADDIEIKSHKSIYLTALENIHVKSHKSMYHESLEDMNILSNQKLNQESVYEMNIKSGKDMTQSTDRNLYVKSDKNTYVEADEKMHHKSGDDMNMESDKDINIKAAENMYSESGEEMHSKTVDKIILETDDRIVVKCSNGIDMQGSDSASDAGDATASKDAQPATPAIDATPEGERDT